MDSQTCGREANPHNLKTMSTFCFRISKDRMRFTDNLDVVKFICKEVWMFLFKKQIDNLKTNHRVCPRFKQLSRTTTLAVAFNGSSADLTSLFFFSSLNSIPVGCICIAGQQLSMVHKNGARPKLGRVCKTGNTGKCSPEHCSATRIRAYTAREYRKLTQYHAIPHFVLLQYLWFPCGILRGILSNLGIASVVVAETSSLPGCTFQIKIAKQN